MNAPSRFDDLLRRWSDAEASVEELAELEGLLRSDARYRRALVRLVRLDVDLYARYARSAAPDPLPPVGAMTMDEMERGMIAKAMRHHEGNISRVAESLGLSRAALYRRLEKYEISA